MLARDGQSGVEVFLLRRRTALAFAAGMHVFPGGGVDQRDFAPCPWAGPTGDDLAEALSAEPDVARAVVVAAVRETFEECGVLLAGPQDAAGSDQGLEVADVRGRAWEQARVALASGGLGLGELLAANRLVLRADLLVPWAHWLTPLAEPRRFDTRFFLAALPAGQQAREVLGEADRAEWVPAGAALARADAGEVAVMPPTRVCLEELAQASGVGALLGTSRRPRRVMPWLGVDEEGQTVVEVDLDGAGGGAQVVDRT